MVLDLQPKNTPGGDMETFTFTPFRHETDLSGLTTAVRAADKKSAIDQAIALWSGMSGKADFAILRDEGGKIIWKSAAE
jgi:hypothetical protein